MSSEFYHSTIEVNDYPGDKLYVENTEQLHEFVKKFNETNNLDEKYIISNYFPNELFQTCRICGKKVIYKNFNINCSENYINICNPIQKRIINDKTYYLSVCEDCLLNHFKDNPPKSSKYYFMKANRFGAFCFGYSYEEYKKICSAITGVTEKSMIKKWGVDLGKQKWQEYKNKQAEKNKFEFKQNKFGWTKEQFDEFNKSRAATLQNMINRYGQELGIEKWKNYCHLQSYTKSLPYMIDKYGEERAKEINSSKALTISTFIRKYGEVEGLKRFKSYLSKHKNYYSKISQKLFKELDKYLSNKYTTYFAAKNENGEFGINLGHKYIFLDYYIKELKICVEFNGTFFHGDPRIFKANDTPNFYNKKITAKEMWDLDNERKNELEKIGIKTFYIWELDYNENFDVKKFIVETLKIEL